MQHQITGNFSIETSSYIPIPLVPKRFGVVIDGQKVALPDVVCRILSSGHGAITFVGGSIRVYTPKWQAALISNSNVDPGLLSDLVCDLQTKPMVFRPKDIIYQGSEFTVPTVDDFIINYLHTGVDITFNKSVYSSVSLTVDKLSNVSQSRKIRPVVEM